MEAEISEANMEVLRQWSYNIFHFDKMWADSDIIIINDQQMHKRQLKSYSTQDNSYMFQHQGTIFRESKIQRYIKTNTTILVLQ